MERHLCFSHVCFRGWSHVSVLPGTVLGLHWWLNSKESACNAGDVKTHVQSLGQENPLETEMVTHFSILAWGIPWTEEPGGLQSVGSKQELDTT